MAIIGYPHSFLAGLSDFWQRFFSDSPQLEDLYKGTAVLVGQAYLDLLSNVLSVSLKDTPIYAKEFYKLVTMREDELAFDWGASLDDDRWVFPLPDGLVAFLSLDNRVIEPTAALEERSDFDIDLTAKTIRFKQDPTDPTGDGTPLAGYARRALDVAVGGAFDDTTRPLGTSWMSRLIYKGDTLRLLDIGPDRESLLGHPRVGASWEGFALHQIVRALAADWRDCHHWRLHTGAELDLLVMRGKRRIGFEIKRTDAPRVTPSMRSALDVLRLDRLYVVHAGAEAWPMDERIAALPLAGLFEQMREERQGG